MDKKVRMTIEFTINEKKCKEMGVSPEEVFECLAITSHNVCDGFEIYPDHPALDVASDFVLEGDVNIISKELVEERRIHFVEEEIEMER